MTVRDLIEELQLLNPDAPIFLAEQPSWPFKYDIQGVYEVGEEVYIAEGNQLDYLSQEAHDTCW